MTVLSLTPEEVEVNADGNWLVIRLAGTFVVEGGELFRAPDPRVLAVAVVTVPFAVDFMPVELAWLPPDPVCCCCILLLLPPPAR